MGEKQDLQLQVRRHERERVGAPPYQGPCVPLPCERHPSASILSSGPGLLPFSVCRLTPPPRRLPRALLTQVVRLEAEAEAHISIEKAAERRKPAASSYGDLAQKARGYEEQRILAASPAVAFQGSDIASPAVGGAELPDPRSPPHRGEEGRLAAAVDRVDAELRLPRVHGVLNGVQPDDDREDMAAGREVGRRSSAGGARKLRGVQPAAGGVGMAAQAKTKAGGIMAKARDRETDPFGFNQNPRGWQR